tara:strand:- start:2694 stop:3131 length:438 start_codon:yes stop_codon:yes gene_type:complete
MERMKNLMEGWRSYLKEERKEMDHRNKDSRAEITKLIRRAEGDAKYLTDMDKQLGWKGAIDEVIDEYFFQMFTGQELADIYGVSFEEFDKMFDNFQIEVDDVVAKLPDEIANRVLSAMVATGHEMEPQEWEPVKGGWGVGDEYNP